MNEYKRGEKCYDHSGDEYCTYSAMCEDYDITFGTFLLRLNKGYSLKECLLGRELDE